MSLKNDSLAPTLDMLEAELAREHHRRNHIIVAFAMVAIAVSLSVAYTLRQGGLAFTREVQVLDCSYDGEAVHTHDAYCYDEDGNLVCTMPEMELHVHDDDCYDEEGNLICGMDAYTHEHVHGSGCFTTITVTEDDPEEAYDEYGEYSEDVYYEDEEPSNPEDLGDEAYGTEDVSTQPEQVEAEAVVAKSEEEGSLERPKQSFQIELTDEQNNHIVTVTAEAPEGALPAKAAMEVEITTTDEIEETIYDAVYSETTARVIALQAVNITFYNEDGERIQPDEPVSIKLTSELISGGEANLVIRLTEDGEAEVVSVLDEEELSERDETVGEDELVFEATEF